MKQKKFEKFLSVYKLNKFMKCNNCNKQMEYKEKLNFNQYQISGWKCSCGETYFNPEDAQKILLLNKLKKQDIKAKLGQIRSNLILRLPKDIENVLSLKKGNKVSIHLEENGFKITPL